MTGDSEAISHAALRGAPNELPQIRLSRVIEWVIAAVLSSTLIAYMLLGNFTRYVADDYGLAVAVRLRGFWVQQIAAYRISDGHFFATASYTAGTLLGPDFVRILPGVLIFAWVALLTLALRHLVPEAGLLGRFLIAAGVVYTTLQVTPNPFLAVYWMTASLEFVVPLLVAAVFVWLITRPRGRRRTATIAAVGLLAFLAAGEAEIYTVAQSVALTVVLAVALSTVSATWRRKLPEISAAWIGSLAGLALELAAPGKAVRSAAIAKLVHVPRPSVFTLPGFAFGQMLHFLQSVLQVHWRELLVIALLAALIGARSAMPPRVGGRSRLLAVVMAFGALVVLFAALTPAAFYYGGLPPVWDQLIPVYICVCGVATLGWLGGRSLSSRVDAAWQRAVRTERLGRASKAAAWVLIAAVVAIGPVATLVSMDRNLPAIQAYAAAKDAEAAGAEAAHHIGSTSATVAPLPTVSELGMFSHPAYEDLMRDPLFWINEDEAAYYGITSMATSP